MEAFLASAAARSRRPSDQDQGDHIEDHDRKGEHPEEPLTERQWTKPLLNHFDSPRRLQSRLSIVERRLEELTPERV